MSQMKTVRTAELIGAALDWAVAKACNAFVALELGGRLMDMSDISQFGARPTYSPSTDWSQGGPLIEKFKITVGSDWDGERLVSVWAYCGPAFEGWPVVTAQEYLVAACRAIVAANLGDEVQIPAELLP